MDGHGVEPVTTRHLTRGWCLGGLAACALLAAVAPAATAQQRDDVSFLRGPYNTAMFHRHNSSYRYSAAFHYHHGRQHDVLQLTPLDQHTEVDQRFNIDVTAFTLEQKAHTEPSMELFGPYVARMAYRVYRAIDWTHMHHEETYDILSEKGIAWSEKQRWTERAVRYYLEKNRGVARSVAPLDVTMRRAAVMMKPYFTYYRNYYPESNNYAYVAHWWHPVIYEAMMLGGNGPAQDSMVEAADRTMLAQVFKDRPQRMLLSRELMPRYSRMSPESANIFDNLHMLHGIVYDILAYEGWTPAQKRAELYRFIDAMSYQPGDEKLARKFREPHPDMDPRVYEAWMQGTAGEMTRIMREMMDEMMPMMMPEMTPEMHEQVLAQFKMKMTPGMQPGEIPGSLHDALMKMMPNMRMMSGSTEPGLTPTMMVSTMLRGWQEKYGDLPDIAPWPMKSEPNAPPPLPAQAAMEAAPRVRQ